MTEPTIHVYIEGGIPTPEFVPEGVRLMIIDVDKDAEEQVIQSIYTHNPEDPQNPIRISRQVFDYEDL